MAPDTLCNLPRVPSTDNFEDLLEDMEFDEGLLRELLDEVNDVNMDKISMMETVVNDIPPLKEKNGDSSHVIPDHESQLLFYQDKPTPEFDYWISQQIAEMPPCSFTGLSFENEMMPAIWHLELENRIEDMMVDDIAYVELWED
ncbi:hypothetical protein L2E82_13974 [Cichorium intybus]|uniref:Uncharacterized protein n=1 Tax=Cichorium intybus TaxID=13427 RepID=A0ACB9EZW7_CICIN|nr:hypothetical protein L1887_33607 [Cichorium endivia]KAI3763976.1 hypothetical protein L2E82_13974 [Cichorium intybus]